MYLYMKFWQINVIVRARYILIEEEEEEEEDDDDDDEEYFDSVETI